MVVVVMVRVGLWRPPTNMNIVIISFNNHNLVGLRAMMMMIVMITVVVVVVPVAVTWVRVGVWSTSTESGVAVRPVDMNERSRPLGTLLA